MAELKSPIYTFVLNQYKLGKFDESHVQKYLKAGRISKEEYQEILFSKEE